MTTMAEPFDAAADFGGRPLICPECGYDVRGLTADGQCPECGRAVADALAATTLYDAEPRWLRQLIIAGWLPAVGMMLMVSVEVVQPVYRFNTGFSEPAMWRDILAAVVDMLPLVALAAGPFLLARPPMPQRFDDCARQRFWLVALLTVTLLCAGVQKCLSLLATLILTLSSESIVAQAEWIGKLEGSLTLVLVPCIGAAAALSALLAANVLRRLPRSSLPRWFRAAAVSVAVGFALATVLSILGQFGVHIDRQQLIGFALGIGSMLLALCGMLIGAVLGIVASLKLRSVRWAAIATAAGDAGDPSNTADAREPD